MAGYDIRAINVAGGGSPERVRAVAVSAGLFEVLATRPTLGRPFRDSDAQPGGPRAIILTHGFWHARFGADPDVVGRTLRLDGRAAEVVGVMPRDFVFPDPATRLLVPLALDEDGRMGSFGTVALARLAPGVTLDAARTEIDQLQQRIPEWFPDLTPDTLAGFGWSTTVEPLRDRVVASVARTLWILFGTAGLVLLAAAANVANLFLVRAESRQREIAVRSALGASRARIARTFLAESLVLAAIGGWTGLLLASAGTRLLAAYGPAGLPRLHEVGLDARVVAFAAALSVVVAVLLGVLPASRIARRPFAALVREDGRGITTGRRGHRVRQVLIVAQVAMAIVLLVGSGLMLRSVARLYAVDPGFRVEGVICAGVSLGPQADRTRAVAFYHDVLDQMARMPGVSAAGAASSLPVGGTGQSGSGFTIRSRPTLHTRIQPFTMYSGVTAGYFDALGVPLLEGRAPARTDAGQGRPVAWVSRTFARQFLDDRAIGEWININIKDTWREIVGVVGDVRIFGLREQVRPMVYLPLSDAAVGIDVMHAVVRTTGSPAALAPALRAAVDRVDASVPLTTVRTMEDIVSASVAEASFTMTLLAIAAGVTLVLGIVGLYGVVSYIVRQRTVEIGIRLALGANPGSVRAMVLRQGVTVAMAGVLVGLAAAAASTRFMASLLFEVSARDPATFAAVALIITAVSALATYLPARRAAGIDPLQALRDQG
jgi:predicted permease